MKKLVIFCLLSAVFSPILPGTESKGFRFRDTIKTAWAKFWSISCDFSTLVSRSKRSIEIPDVSNVDEVFEFLYPMAHVTVDDIKSGKGRSNSEDGEKESSGLFGWFDTVKDLWKTKCKEMRENDQGVPREQQAQETEASDSTPQMNSTTSTKIEPVESPEVSNANTTNTKVSTNVTTEQLSGKDDFTNGTTTNTFGNSTLGQKDSKQGPGFGLPSIFPSVFPSFPPITFPTLSPLASKQVNNFSSSFGGDIEYFFPLISFGLPFDGEITLLGFHGFKGIFPYKR